MQPVLFHLPGIGAINAYGTLILLGGLVAMPGAYRDMQARGMASGRTGSMLIDFYLVLVFGAAIGGRVLHVLTVPGSYVDDPRRLVAMDGTGFVFFGSLAAIVLGFFWLARRYGTTFGAICDLGATWIPLGHVFGRLGCWFAGCCWGAPTDAAWGVVFPEESVAWMAAEIPRAGDHTVALHPSQLYESTALALLFAWLAWNRFTRGIEPTWRQAGRYAVGYGIVRTLLEPLRGDASRGLLMSVPVPAISRVLGLPAEHPLLLSVSQAIGLCLVAAGAWALARSRRGQPAAP